MRKWKLEKKLEVLRSAMVTKKRRSAVARLTRNETIATNIACFLVLWLVLGDENENVRRRRCGK